MLHSSLVSIWNFLVTPMWNVSDLDLYFNTKMGKTFVQGELWRMPISIIAKNLDLYLSIVYDDKCILQFWLLNESWSHLCPEIVKYRMKLIIKALDLNRLFFTLFQESMTCNKLDDAVGSFYTKCHLALIMMDNDVYQIESS